ncbi:MAG: H-NS histone family protein [Azonexus sp.]|nr:H-NS histone family protein [Azonexus sp.]
MDELELIQQQIAELQKKAEELAIQKKQPVIDEIKAKLKAYGITAKDLGLVEVVVSQSVDKPKKPVAIKYRHNEHTWTGRGMKPKWIVKYVEDGGKLEDLLV